MALDIEGLLGEVSPEEPCGPDLSYDPAYFQLMHEAEGTPEHQMGDAVVEGQEPDWRAVKSQAIDLFARTKDLNVTMTLLAALIANDGVTGLADGLDLLKGLLERWWPEFHPKLDPEDNNDPLERMNLISALAAPPGTLGDVRKFQARVREMPLCTSRQLGSFNYRQIQIAKGEIEPPAGMESVPDMALIDGAFSDADIEELKLNSEAASRACATIKAIDAWLMENVGAEHVPDLQSFIVLLESIEKVYKEQLARRGYGQAPADEDTLDDESQGTGDPIRGSVRNTNDVLILIGKICEFYERNEPSSPIPLLLRRAERLVGKNFVDLVRDLSPDALSQLKMVAGVDTFEDQ
ncbi:MAG: type VI secretion system protein TssA [Planctomycetota bacterium]|nr:MAG: type VI secretion system protein TssA [Planctomycetota bacterium]